MSSIVTGNVLSYPRVVIPMESPTSIASTLGKTITITVQKPEFTNTAVDTTTQPSVNADRAKSNTGLDPAEFGLLLTVIIIVLCLACSFCATRYCYKCKKARKNRKKEQELKTYAVAI